MVATSVGLVKNAFSGGDLAPYSGTVHVNKDKLVSVRQAALEINAANRFTVNRCKCKGKCSNAQCSCVPIIVTLEGYVKRKINSCT